jgi:hypothetical protein
MTEACVLLTQRKTETSTNLSVAQRRHRLPAVLSKLPADLHFIANIS